ncbi:class I SAM-dependent methyltransferase [Paenibacillus albidus]|uniref:class I SAM-dependent methyltransferase n=1 Tax=Paenibacillus albidus TaxID=2041023 RepID=UPI001BE656E7|nr:class I SAM-dependent methyltransferase [Paenibacillus albidus]MBT2293758.1 class I SAM-dependent methyltransferase [Paenibacillus albidus]
MQNQKVVRYYDSYDEASRLTSDRARRLEFITTTRILEKYIHEAAAILDEAAGSGVYTFYYADKGNVVTAADITPKHVTMIQKRMERDAYRNVTAQVADATDLSGFASELFDVVLCLGPLYHLQNPEAQRQCIRESLRVLKPGGLLAAAYINRSFIIPHLIGHAPEYLNREFITSVQHQGYVDSDDQADFFASAYFHTPEEVEALLAEEQVEKLTHVATDGCAFFMREQMNQWSEEQYQIWADYHLSTCEERTLLGYSNHGLYVGRKAISSI